MSTTTESASDFDSPPLFPTLRSFAYAITHVFFPVELPHWNDCTVENDLSLADAVCVAARAYTSRVCGTSEEDLWCRITNMLDNMLASVQSERLDKDFVTSKLHGMGVGDIITFFVRPENVAIVVRKRESSTLFESFEVSPSKNAVEKTPGSLRCSYPWFAAEVPNGVFDAEGFQSELADFLSFSGTINDGLPPHHQYVTALFTGPLRGVDQTAGGTAISKRIRDEAGVWRRSSLWLLIRVAIQTSLDRSSVGRAFYKQFILYFVCIIVREALNSLYFHDDLLHLMSSKIIRRLTKLGSSPPDWLSKMALNTSARLREVLDARWKELSIRRSLFRNPTQEELVRDTKLSLRNSGEYIRRVISTPDTIQPRPPFHPNHRPQGALSDFLSLDGAFFDEAYRADRKVTIYDVERSIEQETDDWVAHVVDVDDACAQLDVLMDRYHGKLTEENPEHDSIRILSLLELFIAIDKLTIQEIPMLADYSPGIPVEWLEQLCLRRTTNLHRLSCAYQYLAARELRSRLGWELALSDGFTGDSFPVRYYDQSPHLQELKARITRETIIVDSRQEAERGVVGAQDDNHDQEGRRAPSAVFLSFLLCGSPLHAKAVVFELQCPPCFRIWRSAIARIYRHILSYGTGPWHSNIEERDYVPLADIPELQPYLFEQQLGSHQLRLVYFYSHRFQPREASLCYCVHHSIDEDGKYELWSLLLACRKSRDFSMRYYRDLSSQRYMDSTSHTSNDVLACQASCPGDLSLDEFITFAHLRSGPLLQWFNILCGLHSRTLNLRREEVHFLLSYAVSQVGPLNPNTGTWIWHQELQDPYFCNTFIDELDSLFVDGAGLIDGVFMSTISLLLTRILASSPTLCISERAIGLLQCIRRKMFCWVQELLYDMQMAPLNKERKTSLLLMALACRTTFDVDHVTLPRLVSSAEDIDALLSCSFFIPNPELIRTKYLDLLVARDGRFTTAIEEAAIDVILADPSNLGIDLAIARIYPCYRPGMFRLEALQRPNSRWLTCRTVGIRSQPSNIVHINLLNGQIRVDGLPCGQPPEEISDHIDYQRIFGDQVYFVVPSNLPGMDFMTAATPNYNVHFSLRDSRLLVRARCNQTNQVLEHIPREILQGDLPRALVEGHVHWLNIGSGVAEIWPSGRLWETSAEDWRIDCTSDQYYLRRGRESLVDIQSPTFAMLSGCFSCLVDKVSNILVTTCSVELEYVQSTSRQQVTVTLQTHGLSFFTNVTGELESRDFKNMVYDEDQCIQTFFGLENHLILRSTTCVSGFQVPIPEALVPRVVLVPDGLCNQGKVKFDMTSGTYHTFKLDPELGCLPGDHANLRSVRLLAYLHATTSFHRPDLLTGKTGVQAGLDLIQSAGCRSIAQHRALPHNRSIGDYRSPWSSTKYPQLNRAHNEIQSRYYWDTFQSNDVVLKDLRDARRAAHLFPPCQEVYDSDDSDYPIPTSNVGQPLLPVYRASPVPYYISGQHTRPQITLAQLLSNRTPPELPELGTLPRDLLHRNGGKIFERPAMDRLFPRLQTNSAFQDKYLALLLPLKDDNVNNQSLPTHSGEINYSIDELIMFQKHYTRCRASYVDAIDRLKTNLGPTTDVERALEQFGQWPPITVDVLLRCLASTSRIHLSDEWKKCLVLFAQLLLEVQHARRLLRFILDGHEEEYWKELKNKQCDEWNAEEYPDWLLIQIQGDFLIRRDQVLTAMGLMSPRSGGNTVMQMNMGEGKSSVIIPIVAATLADGKQLVRVIVPKALTGQMFDILVARLGWLANRPIYHLPFSRTAFNSPENRLNLETLRKLLSQCVAERGVLLVQPEHVISLKLMGIEKRIHGIGSLQNHPHSIYQHILARLSIIGRLFSDDSLVGGIFRSLDQSQNPSKTTYCDGSTPDEAKEWWGLLKWIHFNARDILDESDVILHPRFQLIYTLGFEQHMDGYPNRWTITQQILQLVRDDVHALLRDYPGSVECESGQPGSFPRVRIERDSEVGKRLISMISEGVMAGRLPNFDFHKTPNALRDAIRRFISDQNILQVSETAKRVEEYAKRSHQSYLWNGLLLLRGLLSSNILLFALSERWRVDYGLLPQQRDGHGSIIKPQTMLAVPYRAKDVPAPNTQFGHPDLTIVLTCLCYYYAGLTTEQLCVAFEILLDQDDPFAEYMLWIKDYESLPEPLRKLSNINTKSSEEWDNFTFPLFFKNQAVINFYLSRVVFPMGAKAFPWKLCGSSWDLGEKREKLVTGLSGTSDGRWLLPLSVDQYELEHQRGSSSSVLARLVQQELHSRNYIVTHESGRQTSTLELLKLIASQRPEIRVLLDVGAQILDLSNYQVAQAWLDVVRDAEGAVYFDENDEPMILSRNVEGRPLSSSPFSQQLGKCVVYLDHPHTRGIDFKFPVGSRAAVTLGPKVTKDALMQGCMRMRGLGRGHTVMFFASPGVDQSIRSATGKQDREVTISDVICWTIRETWADIEHRAPYWVQQGIDHRSRHSALTSFCNDELPQKQLSDAWLQPNCGSLADLYAPRKIEAVESDLSAVPGVQQRCKDLCVLSITRGGLEEQQELEMQRERECEREVELPPEAKPAKHHLHPDVLSFVKTGVMPQLHSGGAFIPVFTTLERSTAATRDADVWSPSILATADFSRTIEPESTEGTIDQYIRPVQWILSGKTDWGPVLVILSPFEANLLMADIRASKHVHLHLYAPRTAERMKPSDNLGLYAVPPLPSDWTPPWGLIDQLNVFAGQFYLRDYESYLRFCRFLDVAKNKSPSKRRNFGRNLSSIPGSLEGMEMIIGDSPLPTVMALLAIRNRGRPFDHTHMGKILQGQILTKEDINSHRYAIPDLPPLGVEGELVPPRPPKRELAPAENSTVEPASKRPRTITAPPSSLSNSQDQAGYSRASKRALETIDGNEKFQTKRSRAD